MTKPRITGHPASQQNTLDNDKTPRANGAGDAVCHTLAKG
jgi:hypothetical protein